MSGKGHCWLRLCSKKNYERKKYQERYHDAPNYARPDAPHQSSVESSNDSVSMITELSNGLQLLDSLNGTSPIKLTLCLHNCYYTTRLDYSEQV